MLSNEIALIFTCTVKFVVFNIYKNLSSKINKSKYIFKILFCLFLFYFLAYFIIKKRNKQATNKSEEKERSV